MKLDIDLKTLPLIVQISIFAVIANFGIILFGIPMLDALHEEAVQQNSVPQRQITEARRRLENISKEKAFIREKLPIYDKIAERGFFGPQERLVMAQQLEKMSWGLLTNLDYAFQKEEHQPLLASEEGSGKNHLNVTPIELRMEAHTDVEIYRFLQMAMEEFPGYLALTELRIERGKTRFTNQTLRDIGQGKGAGLVNASALLRWQTLKPKDEKKEGQK
jgi:hypothetical protein